MVVGNSNQEIATNFKISEDAVKSHLFVIFEKIGVSTRLELATLMAIGSDDGDGTDIAVRKPKNPNLNRGAAAVSLDEHLE